jgi:hypothetical protein
MGGSTAAVAASATNVRQTLLVTVSRTLRKRVIMCGLYSLS